MTSKAGSLRIASEALERVIGDASALQRQKGMLSRHAHDFHRALLRFFERHGRSPINGELAELAAEAHLRREAVEAAVAELAHVDLLALDERGEVASAYPYSGRPTRHRVEFADGGSVHAMCAVDALGIPLMTGRDATVTSTDPSSGRAIRVEVRDGGVHWDPAEAGVFVGRKRGKGSIAETCCQVIDFFASPEAAAEYHQRGDTQGMWLDQAQALEAGRLAFAALLDATDRNGECRC